MLLVRRGRRGRPRVGSCDRVAAQLRFLCRVESGRL